MVDMMIHGSATNQALESLLTMEQLAVGNLDVGLPLPSYLRTSENNMDFYSVMKKPALCGKFALHTFMLAVQSALG